jgi:hypothetical protein
MRESSTALAYIEEGRQEGRLVTARKLLVSIGTRCLGDLTESMRNQIEANHDVEVLSRLANRIPDVKSWSELLEVN